jgi:acyl carrier protein
MDLKKEFREHLPEYMIPAEIIQYTKFPVTLNGKLDTKALFSDYSKSLINSDISSSGDKDGMNCRTLSPTEKIIHKIWSEALKTDKISVTDNFFDIGGNSVMVISVFSKIESAFDIELDLRVFFDNPRIQALAENVDVFIKRKMKSDPIRTTGDDLKIVGGEI